MDEEPPQTESININGDSWGGWSPPQGSDWKNWVEKWGEGRTSDKPWIEEWNSARTPESGWPQHWKGYGLGNDGVPPPPWAFVPESYDRPEYCFQRPLFGGCFKNLTRWGFNPTKLECETFSYSGCGGNLNNFANKARCMSACVNITVTDTEDKSAVDFEEMIDFEFNKK